MSDDNPAPVDPVDDLEPVDVSDKPRLPTEYEKRLRRENAAARTKLREVEATLTAKLTEAETAAASKLAEMQAAANARLIRAEMKAAALAAGMIDPDGLAILDTSAVKFDDAGNVVIPPDFFDNAKAAKPYLFGAKSTGSTAKPPSNDPPPPADARNMTAEEYAAFRAKVLARR